MRRVLLTLVMLFIAVLFTSIFPAMSSEKQKVPLIYPGVAECPGIKGTPCPKDIILRDADTGEQQVMKVGFIAANGLNYSPDYQKILYGTVSTEYVLDLKLQVVTLLLSPNALLSVSQWSPTGEQIAVSISDGSTPYNLYLLNADGSGKRRLTEGLDVRSGAYWRPDGRALVFSAWTKRRDASHVYQWTLTDSSLEQLTDNESNAFFLNWLDTEKFIYTVYAGDANQLFRYDLPTRKSTQLTRDTDRKWGGWAVSTDSIAYWSRNKNNLYRLYLLKISTGSKQVIVEERDKVRGSDIAPDGKMLAYRVQRSSFNELCVVEMSSSQKHCFRDDKAFFDGNIEWNWG
jgi:Tol biopolymer transport system component